MYIADVDGRIRYHHFGEGEYAAIEMVIQQLLMDAGVEDVDRDLVDVDPVGPRWPPIGGRSKLPVVHGLRAERRIRAGRGGSLRRTSCVHRAPATTLNSWGLAGTWTVARHAAVLNEPGGRIAFRFHARDVNLVMGPASRGVSMPFRVFLDGQLAQDARGTDVASDGGGAVNDQRTYQLIRQSGPIADRTFEIEFLDPGCGGLLLHVRLRREPDFSEPLLGIWVPRPSGHRRRRSGHDRTPATAGENPARPCRYPVG